MGRAGDDFIPRPDSDFAAWADHFYKVLETWWGDQGLDLGVLTPLSDALASWNTAYPAHVAAQATAEAKREAKDAARQLLESRARPIVRFVQSYPSTTNADRANMGISVRGIGGRPAPAPTTRPLVIVEAASRLTHRIRVSDETTPTRRARPVGVLGAEVWVALVDADTPPPTDPAALSFLSMTTRPGVVAEFRSGDGGKTAVYMTRWVNTRGEKGPWSEITTATVAA
jgi:hypothetical protein